MKSVLKRIAPLNLTDPQKDDFRPNGCRTLHDIIRFAHEMSMREMFRISDSLAPDDCAAVPVRAYLPMKILAVDLGNGLRPGRTGAEEDNFFLAVIFPHSQMKILPYNRVVRDLNGLSPEAFLARVGERFSVRPDGPKAPVASREFAIFLGGRWFGLAAKPGTFDPADPIGSLDVSILQANLLAPVLGIADPRTDKRIQFVGGIRGTAELERLVTSGKAAVAFSMFPVSVGDLMGIADAGEIMPPKSTWFEPKLRDALLIHTI